MADGTSTGVPNNLDATPVMDIISGSVPTTSLDLRAVSDSVRAFVQIINDWKANRLDTVKKVSSDLAQDVEELSAKIQNAIHGSIQVSTHGVRLANYMQDLLHHICRGNVDQQDVEMFVNMIRTEAAGGLQQCDTVVDQLNDAIHHTRSKVITPAGQEKSSCDSKRDSAEKATGTAQQRKKDGKVAATGLSIGGLLAVLGGAIIVSQPLLWGGAAVIGLGAGGGTLNTVLQNRSIKRSIVRANESANDSTAMQDLLGDMDTAKVQMETLLLWWQNLSLDVSLAGPSTGYIALLQAQNSIAIQAKIVEWRQIGTQYRKYTIAMRSIERMLT